ncbi:hypothetical protein PMAYCL1PPCAC_08418, partial [Pristionchus mayeri]
ASSLKLPSLLRFIIKMLRIISIMSFISMTSAAILIPRGFAVAAVREVAATCADTQSPDICTPSTCKTMPSLGFDMCRKSCGWCDLSEPPCQNAADDGICDAYKAADQCSMKSVETNCAKSCGICTPAPPAPSKDCENIADDGTCDGYAAAELCSSGSVKANCQKSCNLC